MFKKELVTSFFKDQNVLFTVVWYGFWEQQNITRI